MKVLSLLIKIQVPSLIIRDVAFGCKYDQGNDIENINGGNLYQIKTQIESRGTFWKPEFNLDWICLRKWRWELKESLDNVEVNQRQLSTSELVISWRLMQRGRPVTENPLVLVWQGGFLFLKHHLKRKFSL